MLTSGLDDVDIIDEEEDEDEDEAEEASETVTESSASLDISVIVVLSEVVLLLDDFFSSCLFVCE